MTLIPLPISVPNITAVLALFNRIKVYRSTVGEIGPYVELTTAATRPVLEPTKTFYEYLDPTGSSTYWYRSAFFHSVSSLESALSDPQQGGFFADLGVLSIEELKQHYLFGVDLTDDQGQSFPDSMFAHHIRSAVAWLESHLGIPITPRHYAEEKHDYARQDYEKWVWLSLDHYPVLSVESVKLVLPGEQVVKDFGSDWVHVQANSGQLQLMPPQGSVGVIALGTSGAWLPFLFTQARVIPDAFRVAYDAGFAQGQVPEDIRAMIAKKAAIGALNIAGDLIAGAGIASISLGLDGLSQSISTTSSATNSGYGARILEYLKEIKEDLPQLKRQWRGVRMVVA